MKFPCTATRLADGRWLARHDGTLGAVDVTAHTRDAVLEKLRAAEEE